MKVISETRTDIYVFLLAIVLSVRLRFTDSDYPFDIFKLFLICMEVKTQNFEFVF